MMTQEQILNRLKGTDDYTFISSKMGDVVVSHLVETILEWLEYDRKIYENKAGEACIALAKILVAKQYTDITDDEIKISAMYLEEKRKQDEINYIQSLRNQIEELSEELKVARKSGIIISQGK